MSDIIDKALMEEQEKNVNRIRSGKISPSGFGTCFRKQYYDRLNIPKTNPPDLNSLRRFKCGKLFHDYIQKFIPKAQTEVKYEDDDVLSYIDIVLDDRTVEIKSVHSRQFWYFTQKGFNINVDKRPNILQAVSGAMFMNKPMATLLFVSKDDLCTSEYDFKVEVWKDEVTEELNTLKYYFNNKEIPKAIPRAFNSVDLGDKECDKYCGFRDYCYKCENYIPKPTTKKEK